MATIAIGSATGREAATRATSIRHGAVRVLAGELACVRRIAVKRARERAASPASGPRRVSGPGSRSDSAPGRGGSLSARSGSRLGPLGGGGALLRTRLPNSRFPNSAMQRGHERDRDDHADHRRERQAGAERAEELELADDAAPPSRPRR